ncbi:MAG: hypothetical protein ACREQ5_09915 [Candidatus Dormibacteria bacterium]
MSRTPEYKAWCRIKQKCLNPKEARFRLYGGRGIKVCDRWLDDFEAFLADMGPRPSGKHSIERLNNDGDYAPDNCVWLPAVKQARNSRMARFVGHDGKRMSLSAWAETLGVQRFALSYRLNVLHLSLTEAIRHLQRGDGRAGRKLTVSRKFLKAHDALKRGADGRYRRSS